MALGWDVVTEKHGETPDGERWIADVFCTKGTVKIVFQVQWPPQSVEEFKRRQIAATIIAMGHTLGFKVLAEGVETPEQLAFLLAKGCDSYQGYIKSKPVSAHEFAELLRKQQQDEL